MNTRWLIPWFAVGAIFACAVIVGCGSGAGGGAAAASGSAIYYVTRDGYLHIANDISLSGEKKVVVGLGEDVRIARDSQGRIIFASRSSNQVGRIDNPPSGEVTKSLGGSGTDPNKQFDNLTGIGLDSSDRIYILCSKGVLRVDDLDGNGSKALSAPPGDPNPTHISVHPTGIAIGVSGAIYFVDPLLNAVFRVDNMDGRNWTQIGGASKIWANESYIPLPNGEHLNTPRGISIDIAGHLFISDTGDNRIIYMEDINGTGFKTLSSVAGCALDRPDSIAQDGHGRLYIAEGGAHRLIRVGGINGSEWAVSDVIGPLGPTDPTSIFVTGTPAVVAGNGDSSCVATGGGTPVPFAQANSVRLDARGRIYVADANNRRVVRMNDMTGAGAVVLTRSANDQLGGPIDLFVDTDGKIYILDGNEVGGRVNYRVVRVDDMTGANWLTYGSYSTDGAPGHFRLPNSLWVDAAHRIYVADTGQMRVARFNDMTGAGWLAYAAPVPPRGVAVAPGGRIYVTVDDPIGVIRIDDMTGSNRVDAGIRFGTPERIFLDTTRGKILVADSLNDQIVQMDDNDSFSNVVRLGARGGGTSQFYHPVTAVTYTGGQIFVADQFNHRIVRMNDITGAGWTQARTYTP